MAIARPPETDLENYEKGKLPLIDENISQEASNRKRTETPRERPPHKKPMYKVPATDRPKVEGGNDEPNE